MIDPREFMMWSPGQHAVELDVYYSDDRKLGKSLHISDLCDDDTLSTTNSSSIADNVLMNSVSTIAGSSTPRPSNASKLSHTLENNTPGTLSNGNNHLNSTPIRISPNMITESPYLNNFDKDGGSPNSLAYIDPVIGRDQLIAAIQSYVESEHFKHNGNVLLDIERTFFSKQVDMLNRKNGSPSLCK
ncbi:hypothetical protein BBOV_II005460 [Babesia bovis T2Bo]|uniref:Uncharacterized protein n=1 Tax=Babesia bovis TaxID=5865 RepID=A7AU86_BABBO|nr:hypothetical protein BBOV_II005460 [Babesia bovis T2Bo]EDO06497.1 hypothetical protein BBOV_II005460 [Babesia bovis T2Bo]BAN65887.1 hypothetical protein [Babesia bovis]|eukprot:XP_001610065.1 hypothetical protein [Babesia bovis T2Bo]